MKILLTHRYFWPDTVNCGQILKIVAEHFSSQGHTVEVITSLPSYNLDSLKIYSKKKAGRGYNSAFSIKGWRYDSCLYLVYNNNITNILCQPTI